MNVCRSVYSVECCGGGRRLYQTAKQFLICALLLFLFVNPSLSAETIFLDPAGPELRLSDKQLDQQVVKEKNEPAMSIGLGAGVWMLPEESSYRSEAVPSAVIFTWKLHLQEELSLQAGYSTASSIMRYQAYKTDWENRLTTRTLYFSYRLIQRTANTIKIYGLAGLAYFAADLQLNKKSEGRYSKIKTYQDEGFGYIAGAGFHSSVKSFFIGAELNIFSRTARFDGIENAVGHNQILVTCQYQFGH